MVTRLRDAGAAWLCVHGRTREQRKSETKQCNFEIIRVVKEHIRDIPIFANGGCETLEDVQKCLEYTKCDAYMAAESLLGNPAMLLSKEAQPHPLTITQDYIDMCKKYKSVTRHMIRGHVFKLLYRELAICTQVRRDVGCLREPYLYTVCDEIREHKKKIGEDNFDKLLQLTTRWYQRFRKDEDPPSEGDKTLLLEHIVAQIDALSEDTLTPSAVATIIHKYWDESNNCWNFAYLKKALREQVQNEHKKREEELKEESGGEESETGNATACEAMIMQSMFESDDNSSSEAEPTNLQDVVDLD
ncbi:hypothetical protein RFI_06397 [Reticulomyxa filosa]|uniref:DUS-like FMN-binding domain-containing protein n=1 Tax=Reticulomyxa filosa TaxID=46433 RepID=X6NZJ9_RETFI|nr:hypothetical protein RFI_06397 [Reticulomyxa filosa]|eukprot:ETO30722.1 hypothetical protein RFI_06397 [Reticulomyxa filosa]